MCQSEEVLEADLVYKTNVQDELGAGVKAGIAGRATGSIGSDQQGKKSFELAATIFSWELGSATAIASNWTTVGFQRAVGPSPAAAFDRPVGT